MIEYSINVLCCDWLSNCLFLQRSHTIGALYKQNASVVIGFQIVYFYREVTHYKTSANNKAML